MDDQELFRKMDETERLYAPDQVPDAGAQARVDADEGQEVEPIVGVPAIPPSANTASPPTGGIGMVPMVPVVNQEPRNPNSDEAALDPSAEAPVIRERDRERL